MSKKLLPSISLSVLASLILGVNTLCSMSVAFAGTSTASPKATATISSSCQISAQSLSFGNLVLPLSAQSASTSMNVLCSKNASFNVGLAYGGVYGTAVTANWILVGANGKILALNTTTETDKVLTSVPAGYVLTHASANCYNSFGEPAAADIGPYNCAGYQTTGTQYTMSSYAYGKMTGVAKGDTIGYFIQVPGNPGQVWNTGNSSYSSTGTGSSVSIPVVGTLVPSQSGSVYPTPDMYMDTVTATINF